MEGGLLGFGTLDIAIHAFIVQSLLFGIMYVYINLPRPEARQYMKQFLKKAAANSTVDTTLDNTHMVAAGFRRDPVYYGGPETTVDDSSSLKLRFIRPLSLKGAAINPERRCLNCHAHLDE
jgi:hypothetical protein